MYKILTAGFLALVSSLALAQATSIFSSNEALENSFLNGKNYVSADCRCRCGGFGAAGSGNSHFLYLSTQLYFHPNGCPLD